MDKTSVIRKRANLLLILLSVALIVIAFVRPRSTTWEIILDVTLGACMLLTGLINLKSQSPKKP